MLWARIVNTEEKKQVQRRALDETLAGAAAAEFQALLEGSGLSGASPGMFARAWLPVSAGADTRLYVPARAVVRRAELSAVYVLGSEGRPLLRQVRLGRIQGNTVEVLAGVSAGERVVLDPQAASRLPLRDAP